MPTSEPAHLNEKVNAKSLGFGVKVLKVNAVIGIVEDLQELSSDDVAVEGHAGVFAQEVVVAGMTRKSN
jgi:hypothetical protein